MSKIVKINANVKKLQKYNQIVKDRAFKTRSHVEFVLESFSFTKCKPPEDHHELTVACIAGDVQSGKTWSSYYYASLCKRLWKDDIDFYDCEDLFQTIISVKESKKYAHFIRIDDAIKEGLDARQSMRGANISASQKFLKIRQLIYKGYFKGGYL